MIPFIVKPDIPNPYALAIVVTWLPMLVLGAVIFSPIFDLLYYKCKLNYLKPSIYFKG